MQNVEQLERLAQRRNQPHYALVLPVVRADPDPLVAGNVLSRERIAVLEFFWSLSDQSLKLEGQFNAPTFIGAAARIFRSRCSRDNPLVPMDRSGRPRPRHPRFSTALRTVLRILPGFRDRYGSCTAA